MSKKKINRFSFILIVIIASSFLGIVIHNFIFPTKQIEAKISLKPDKPLITSLGRSVYSDYCASYHGANLAGQLNWRQRDLKGYLPVPPHDKIGHIWHHSDQYLFLMTKYGIEEIIGKKYKNNMPVYENELKDTEIIAVLSYIKSTWPDEIQKHHDSINSR